MPKLITTRPRIADLGKPRTIKDGGGLEQPEVARGHCGFNARAVLFDTYKDHSVKPLSDQVGSLVSHSAVSPGWKRSGDPVDSSFGRREVNRVRPAAGCRFAQSIALPQFRNRPLALFNWPLISFAYKRTGLIIVRPEDGVH